MRDLTHKEARALVEYSHRKQFAIDLFRPDERQEAIFRSQARELLILGGNRAGKTLSASVRFASIAMDRPIIFSDGSVHHQRRPHQRGKCLRLWTISIDLRHVGQTIYRMLFKPGEAFKIIRDEHTGEWRSWRRWEPADAARESEVRGAPALIPARCVDQKSWSWESKAERAFSKVVIIDPVTKEPTAEIFAYGSKGDPKAGDPIDHCWLDEHLQYEEHYAEFQARLVDRNGNLMWSSWPQLDNDSLVKLHERCEADSEKPPEERLHECVRLTMSGNRSLDQKSVNEFLESCATEEDRMARDLGLFITEQLRSYPLFDPNIHSAIISDSREPDDLSRVLEENDGRPPLDWTRYLILDPGTQKPAVLLCAVPPPKFGDYVVAYDEIYPGRADAIQLAKKVRERTLGQRFYKFIVDFRAARQTTMGMKLGMTVYDAYSEAFKAERLQCATTGSRFEMGSDDVGGRIAIVRKWLHLNDKGFPKLRIVTHKCPNLCKQMKKVKKQVANKEELDDRHAKGQEIDVLQALEYFAAARPTFEILKENPAEFSSGYAWYLKKFGNKKQEAPSIVAGPRYRPS